MITNPMGSGGEGSHGYILSDENGYMNAERAICAIYADSGELVVMIPSPTEIFTDGFSIHDDSLNGKYQVDIDGATIYIVDADYGMLVVTVNIADGYWDVIDLDGAYFEFYVYQ